MYTMARRSTCNRLPGVTSTLPRSITISALIDSSTVGPRDRLSDGAAVKQMADDMRSFGRDCVTDLDLKNLGWKEEQIKAYCHLANLRALRLSHAAA
jgi:hypothetical protein